MEVSQICWILFHISIWKESTENIWWVGPLKRKVTGWIVCLSDSKQTMRMYLLSVQPVSSSFRFLISARGDCISNRILHIFTVHWPSCLLRQDFTLFPLFFYPWTCACGIGTLESLLQAAGVWSCVLDESSSVCLLRIIPFKKNSWNCPSICRLPRSKKAWWSSSVQPAYGETKPSIMDRTAD